MADPPVHLDSRWLLAFYRTNHRSLAAYAATLTRTLDEAEDVVHDAFTAALAARVSAESPAAYLFRMVRNKAIDRRRGEALRCEAGRSVEVRPETGADGEELVSLRTALETLPPDAGEVVTLRARAGLSFPEIARVLGEPVGTVSARYTRAIAAMRAQLMEEPIHE